MLRRLQWRFIRVAMVSLLVVFLFLLAAINLLNYWNFRGGADAMLRLIADNDGRLPDYVDITAGELHPEEGLHFNEETPFFTRFFVVHGSEGHEIQELQLEKIAAITGADAERYYAEAVSSGKTYGFCDDYRYLVTSEDGAEQVVFLDCERDLQAVRTFLWISVAVAAFAYGAVFLLVYVLSGRAIRPMVRNLEQQKQFITDAGHELKTPLTVISTSADVLSGELRDNEWLRNIRRQTAHMKDLIDHLITLSRMEEEEPRMNRDTFNLSDAVWDVAAQFQPVAEAQGKKLLLNIEDDVPFRGDAAAIEQMISLLLDNAVKYSDGGSTIRLRLHRDRGAVLTLENDCALPEDLDPERLFDRFYRLDPARSRSTGGSGIGLAVARAIAQAHGGTLTAETVAGGIRFTAEI